MINNWSELESWIRGNNLSRWIFTKSNRDKAGGNGEGGAPNDKIVDSDYYGDNFEDKLAITKKNLEQYGRVVYGYGWQGGKRTDGICCEVLLAPGSVMPTAGIGSMYTQEDIAGMENRLRQQIKAEFEAQEYKRQREEFEKEKKAFEEKEAGVWGLLVNHLAPVAKATIGRNFLPKVAGVETIDAERDVQTARIEAQEPEDEEPAIENPFTEEEEDKAFRLLARFKAAEPENWLKMIEKVVTMAESGDPMYGAAKGFLVG